MSYDLIALTAKVKSAHLDVEAACDNALDHALKAGDFLREIVGRDLVKYGQREAFFKEVCGASRTGQTYVQLAEHRKLIDQKRLGSARLSIADALRLIRKAEAKPKRTSKPEAAKTAEIKAAKPEAPLPDFSGMSDLQWTEALTALGIRRFLRVIPKDWRVELQFHTLELARTKTAKKRQQQLKHDHPHLALVH